jgi:hypothetical protein
MQQNKGITIIYNHVMFRNNTNISHKLRSIFQIENEIKIVKNIIKVLKIYQFLGFISSLENIIPCINAVNTDYLSLF